MSLDKLQRPPDTELIIITDGDNDLQMAIDKRLDSISYSRIQVFQHSEYPLQDRNSRRYRISDIHNEIRRHISPYCNYVFSVEDDTVYPADALTKMLGFFEYSEDCGFVEGIELGRHKTKYVGGWKADNVEDPKIISSIMPDFNAQELELLAMNHPVMERIDAGGLYCALIKADLYKNHHFEPFDKVGDNGLSCDINLGFSIRKQGYKCYADWSISCDHIGDKGSVNLGNTRPVQVMFEKRFDRWDSRVVAPPLLPY